MSKVITRRRRTASKVGRAKPVADSRARPYITRAIPCLDILDDDSLAMIEREADTLMKEVGMDFRGDTEVLKIMADAGATVDGERIRLTVNKDECALEAFKFVQPNGAGGNKTSNR